MLSRKKPEPVSEPVGAFTEIETTAGITRAARAAIESGARSTIFLVSTKFAPRFVEVFLPIDAPIPPATSATITTRTKKMSYFSSQLPVFALLDRLVATMESQMVASFK